MVSSGGSYSWSLGPREEASDRGVPLADLAGDLSLAGERESDFERDLERSHS